MLKSDIGGWDGKGCEAVADIKSGGVKGAGGEVEVLESRDSGAEDGGGG